MQLFRIMSIALDLRCGHRYDSLALLTVLWHLSAAPLLSDGWMTSLTKINCFLIQEIMEAGVNSVGCLSLNGNFFRICVAYFRIGNPNSSPLLFPVRNSPFGRILRLLPLNSTSLDRRGRQSKLFLGVVWYPMIS